MEKIVGNYNNTQWKCEFLKEKEINIVIKEEINSNIIPQYFFTNLQHEIAHAFDNIYHGEDSLTKKYRTLYYKTNKLIQSSRNVHLKDTSLALYYSLNNETVANLRHPHKKVHEL